MGVSAVLHDHKSHRMSDANPLPTKGLMHFVLYCPC